MPTFLSPISVIGPTANGPATVGTNTTTAAGGLWFGTDTNLYRSAADTLRTDDSMFVNGTMAVGGVALDPAIGINSNRNVTDPSAVQYGGVMTRTLVLTSTNASQVIGGSFNTGTSGGAFNPTGEMIGSSASANHGTTATATFMAGARGLVYNQAAGTIGVGVALNGRIQNLNATGVITNAYGVRVEVPFNTGTIGNTYGLFVGTVTVGTQTNQAYGLFVQDANARNYMGGYLGLGTTAPASRLSVTHSDTDPSVVTLSGSSAVSISKTANYTAAEAGSSTSYGLFVDYIKSGVGAATASTQNAIYARALASGGNINTMQAIVGQYRNTGSGIIAFGAGFRAEAPANSGGGSITEGNGVYVVNQGLAGMTTSYGMRILPQTGATSTYGLAIGAATTQTLWVGRDADSTTADAGIAFGSSRDTTLYRSAVGTLRTGVLALGPTPATSGFLRMGNNCSISAHDSTNAVDVPILTLNTSNWAVVNGLSAVAFTLNGSIRMTVATNIAITDSVHVNFGTTGGSMVGLNATQKFAFWGTTPIVQPPNTTAIDDLLVATGLRATGGTANFSTSLTVAGTYASIGTNPATGSGGLRLSNNQGVAWRNVAGSADIVGVNVNAADSLILNAGSGGSSTVTMRVAGTDVLTVTGSALNFVDGTSVQTGVTTGTRIGTASAQKLAFWGATPVVEPTNTVAIDDLLVTTGLRASGGTANFTTAVSSPSLKLGTATLTGRLSLVAGTTAADGITWGTDTNLYRSAVDTLKTDDSLIVDGTLTVTGAFNATLANVPAGGIAATTVQAAINELDTEKLAKANNLSDLASAATARTNLGLGGAAVLAVGTTAGTVAAGDDARFTTAAFTTKTANYTATGSDYAIWVDSTSTAVTIVLPTAVGRTGQCYEVKDWKGQSASNNITLDPAGTETIDGALTKVLTSTYQSITIRSDGSNWGIV